MYFAPVLIAVSVQACVHSATMGRCARQLVARVHHTIAGLPACGQGCLPLVRVFLQGAAVFVAKQRKVRTAEAGYDWLVTIR